LTPFFNKRLKKKNRKNRKKPLFCKKKPTAIFGFGENFCVKKRVFFHRVSLVKTEKNSLFCVDLPEKCKKRCF
jgi:hypothetical protein